MCPFKDGKVAFRVVKLLQEADDAASCGFSIKHLILTSQAWALVGCTQGQVQKEPHSHLLGTEACQVMGLSDLLTS